ncbi:MAG: cytidylate kinase family protein [Candidatus Norongarragalinales archaeon]
MRIAISGPTACGNSTASRLVAKALRLKKYNYTFHDLARESKIPFEKLHAKAEKDARLDVLLDRKQIEFALKEKNCVVGTRLAVFLDRIAPQLGMKKPAFDLKVWLDAPEPVRAGRLAKRDKKSADAALKEIRYRDSSNKKRYKKLYNLDFKKPVRCLLVDNSSLDAKQTAALIITAARKA